VQIDPAEVSTETRTFVDSDRATPPNGDFTGAESRTIKTNRPAANFDSRSR
jgi:hypothetical protein